ncbi:MAG: Tetraacyldisaccharide 4'-kinase [Phycisphaerae bacterium]|nr:Tetraacyldisaccharide 4'-kinase [Phycisphaerae bacterium]
MPAGGGPAATLLAPLAALYTLATDCRNAIYDRLRWASSPPPIPVISVGNITAGGTGKTPLVIELVRRLRARGRDPAILTRGYRGARGQPADEVREFGESLPGTAVVVDADRVRGARTARAAHGADCAVLDDGFQHRRLRRQLDLVLIDALDPWGGGRLLPAGRLRERLAGLARAELLVISRANLAPPAQLDAIETRLARIAPAVPRIRAAVWPEALRAADGVEHPLDALAGRRVVPLCGIGNPESFLATLRGLGAEPCAVQVFPDHHAYRPAELARVSAAAAAAHADIVTTRKDWVKLSGMLRPGPHAPLIMRLEMRLELADPAGVLNLLLDQALEQRLAPL